MPFLFSILSRSLSLVERISLTVSGQTLKDILSCFISSYLIIDNIFQKLHWDILYLQMLLCWQERVGSTRASTPAAPVKLLGVSRANCGWTSSWLCERPGWEEASWWRIPWISKGKENGWEFLDWFMFRNIFLCTQWWNLQFSLCCLVLLTYNISFKNFLHKSF